MKKRKARAAKTKKAAAQEQAGWKSHLRELDEDDRLAKLAFELLREAYDDGGAAVWERDFVRAGIQDVDSAIADLQRAGYEIWFDLGCRRPAEPLQAFYQLIDDELDPADDEELELDDDEGEFDA
jgi:hypothetical protein